MSCCVFIYLYVHVYVAGAGGSVFPFFIFLETLVNRQENITFLSYLQLVLCLLKECSAIRRP
jgi:hypothetical protein